MTRVLFVYGRARFYIYPKEQEMIYIANMTDAQALLVPRNGEPVSGSLRLRLRNTVDHQEVDVPVTDLQTSDIYANVSVELPEGLASGEYEYRLSAEDGTVSTGLLIVGGYAANLHQHEETIKYKQYEQ